MKKFKAFVKRNVRKLSAVCVATVATSAMAVSAFAAGDTSTATTSATVISAFTTGFQALASDAMSMIGAMVPIALGVAGVIFLARKAMGWFKSLAK